MLLLQYNQHFYLDVSVSILDLNQKKFVQLLPVLVMIVMRRGKKSVIRVAQRVAALVPVQGLPSFFWTENPTKVLDGSKRQYIFGKKGSNP